MNSLKKRCTCNFAARPSCHRNLGTEVEKYLFNIYFNKSFKEKEELTNILRDHNKKVKLFHEIGLWPKFQHWVCFDHLPYAYMYTDSSKNTKIIHQLVPGNTELTAVQSIINFSHKCRPLGLP